MIKTQFVPKSRVVSRMDHLAEMARGKRVLNIGMGGFIDDDDQTNSLEVRMEDTLQSRLYQVAEHVTGADINPKSIAIMKRALPEGRYVHSSVSASDFVDLVDDRFDLIIFGDVIEHLDDLRSALQNLRALLNERGVLVITTANAFNIEAIAKYVFRYESVHPEHTCYFSFSTLRRLLAMNGLKIDTVCFSVQTRPARTLFDRIGYTLLRGVSSVLPHFGQGIIVHATRSEIG